MGIKPPFFPKRHQLNTYGSVNLKTKSDLMWKLSWGQCFWLHVCPNRHLQIETHSRYNSISYFAPGFTHHLIAISPLVCVLPSHGMDHKECESSLVKDHMTGNDVTGWPEKVLNGKLGSGRPGQHWTNSCIRTW